MARTIYCWRCKADIPMLDEDEWEQISTHLANGIEQIKRYREAHGVSLAEARRDGFGAALEMYFQLTGFREENADAIWHHRLSEFGPLCRECGKPLRTPRAKLCAECGAPRSTE
jgi:hypothetical protein